MTTLRVPEGNARAALDVHAEEGVHLIIQAEEVRRERGVPEWNVWKLAFERWGKLVEAALRHLYEDREPLDVFQQALYGNHRIGGTWLDELGRREHRLRNAVNELSALMQGLQYAAPARGIATAQSTPTTEQAGTGRAVVFLVHGHDHGTRETVARFLERNGPADVDVVILEEQADKGRTVLEKLEDHAADSKYAVVLMTPDDIGATKPMNLIPTTDDPSLQHRARQNVIFEFGWFCGLIGRENVAVLHHAEVELPSDLSGLVYIALNTDWQKRLVRELKASGFDYHT